MQVGDMAAADSTVVGAYELAEQAANAVRALFLTLVHAEQARETEARLPSAGVAWKGVRASADAQWSEFRKQLGAVKAYTGAI